MEAYLDNSATTRCCEEAAQLVVKLLTEDYGNPSSLHNKGVIAENYMNDARKKIAKTLKVQEKEICFTSGGTESNNLAIIGVAEAEHCLHIINEKDFTTENIDLLIDFAKANGGIEYAEQRMQVYHDKAVEVLMTLPESEAREGLLLLADYIVERRK